MYTPTRQQANPIAAIATARRTLGNPLDPWKPKQAALVMGMRKR